VAAEPAAEASVDEAVKKVAAEPADAAVEAAEE
jgi:hypothetical protein